MDSRVQPVSRFDSSEPFGTGQGTGFEEYNLGPSAAPHHDGALVPPSEQHLNVTTVEDIPPDGGYGWVVTACVFLANAHTWGVNSSWGVLLNHYLTVNKFPGATKFEFALIGGLSISQALLVAPLVVTCQRKFGTRNTMLLGSVVVFAALISAGESRKIWQLILSQGVCFGWGMGLIYLPATEVLPHWFSAKRSLAVGFATSGAGLGGLAYSLITGQLIPLVGVVWTYRILSIASLIMNALGAFLLKERVRPARSKPQRAFNLRHFARVEVLLIMFWGFVTELGYIALLYSLPTYATSIGLSATQGSVTQALLNLGLGIGRPVLGYFSDRLGRINIAMFNTLICSIFVFTLWIPAHTYPLLLIFAVLVGTVCGTFWGTIGSVLTEVVGLVEFGSILGSIMFALVLPTTFAEAIAMQLVDGQSSVGAFLGSQLFVGFMFVAGAISLFLLRSWKIAEIEMKGASDARAALTAASAVNGSSTNLPRRSWLTPRRAFRLERV